MSICASLIGVASQVAQERFAAEAVIWKVGYCIVALTFCISEIRVLLQQIRLLITDVKCWWNKKKRAHDVSRKINNLYYRDRELLSEETEELPAVKKRKRTFVKYIRLYLMRLIRRG